MQFHGAAFVDDKAWLVMEFMGGGAEILLVSMLSAAILGLGMYFIAYGGCFSGGFQPSNDIKSRLMPNCLHVINKENVSRTFCGSIVGGDKRNGGGSFSHAFLFVCRACILFVCMHVESDD